MYGLNAEISTKVIFLLFKTIWFFISLESIYYIDLNENEMENNDASEVNNMEKEKPPPYTCVIRNDVNCPPPSYTECMYRNKEYDFYTSWKFKSMTAPGCLVVSVGLLILNFIQHFIWIFVFLFIMYFDTFIKCKN